MANYTQTKLIKLVNKCNPKAVYLRWLSPLGNYEGYLFAGKKQQDIETENAVTFRSADSRHDETKSRTANPVYLLRTVVPDRSTAKALQHLFTSPKVKAVIEGKEYDVTVSSNGATLFSDADKRQFLDVQITLPYLNALTQ